MLLATSEIAREVDRALWLIGGVSVVLLAGITLAMVVFSIKFRRGKSPRAPQIEGHKWLEVAWIVIPTIIVTWLFFVGYKGFALMRNVPPDAMVVEVTGKQWMWSFHYPEEKLDTAEMVVPVGKPVKVELTSPRDDVVHSFFIPDFRVKEDAVPGRQSYLWFEAEREGDYNIFCAEFCGKDHSQMLSVLRVVGQREYDEWVTAQRMKRYEPLVFEAVVDRQHEKFGKGGLNIDDEALFKTYCRSCHGSAGDGSGLPDVARNADRGHRADPDACFSEPGPLGTRGPGPPRPVVLHVAGAGGQRRGLRRPRRAVRAGQGPTTQADHSDRASDGDSERGGQRCRCGVRASDVSARN